MKSPSPCCMNFPTCVYAQEEDVFRPFADMVGMDEEEIILSLSRDELYSRLDQSLEDGWDLEYYILWLRHVAINSNDNSPEEMAAGLKALVAESRCRSTLLLAFLNGNCGTKTKMEIINNLHDSTIVMFFLCGQLAHEEVQMMALDALPPFPFSDIDKKLLWANRHLYTQSVRDRLW